MDVYCPKCGEPCDLDSFHDRADELETSAASVRADFRAQGCRAMGWTCADSSPERAAIADAMFDLLGDDIDGIAAMMQDAGF